MKTATQKTVNTNSKEFKTKFFAYLLSCIDGSGYGKELTTDAEKLQFVSDCFKSEYLCDYELKRTKNYQDCFASWISGLPSSFNIDFENYRILELSFEFGSITENTVERRKEQIISNWFNFVSFKMYQLCEANGVKLW